MKAKRQSKSSFNSVTMLDGTRGHVKVISLSEKWCIIDFGLNAICEIGWNLRGLLPEGCK